MKKYNLRSKVGKVATFTSNMLQLFAALVLTMFVIVVGGFLFYIWGSHEVGKRLDIGYGTSTSPRLVQLEIGDKHFAIPQNYIWSRDSWNGGKVVGVNMHALLPNFEPLTEANKNEFEKPGWNEMALLQKNGGFQNNPLIYLIMRCRY